MTPNDPQVPEGTVSRRRVAVFALVLVACIAGMIGYLLHVGGRTQAALDAAPAVAATPLDAAGVAATTRPYVMFRSTALGETYGRVSLHFLGEADTQRQVSALQCDRVHFSSGRGICLSVKRGVPTTYLARVFDDKFEVTHSYQLVGPPSRARVSPDGRLIAFTVFVTGHAYSSPGFVTRTSIVDGVSGEMVVDDLEKFQLLHDGASITAVDRNFWGVTFSRDGKRFYATAATGGKAFLVEGDIAARQMKVIHDDVECPSLSPDGTRIAFKRRAAADGSGRIIWGLHVLDLATRKETALAREVRNVDDQVEWFNESEIAYSMSDDAQHATVATNVWALAADGTQPPRLVLPLAFSPAVGR